ncbi:hypothetical protein Cpir12675_002239 [Ceratocystis pirilliformis]|uniref:Heterokaryon incompatibility domain-containing protein n=1 Tax=Ceratocystis pirilliformis TaxID=259994 RepID=A0ABR3ZBQ4_9PEZI
MKGFEYSALPTAKSIRLVQIVPRQPDEDLESQIHLKSRVVHLSLTRLRRGESKTPPLRPSINFDSYVTQPLYPERFRVLENKGLRQRLREKFKRDTAPKYKAPPSPNSEEPPADLVLGGRKKKSISSDLSSVLIRDGLLDSHSCSSSVSDICKVKCRPLRTATDSPNNEPQFRDRYSWGSDHGPISGNYVALSYSSTTETEPELVTIDGANKPVNASVVAALRRFRELELFKNGLWMWVDTICINKEDPAEVASQLELVSTIYQQAGNVIIWLGEPIKNDPISRAMAYVQEISRHCRNEYLRAFDHDPAASPGHRQRARLQLYATKKIWQDKMSAFMEERIEDTLKLAASIFTLYGNPYWRRRWVVQELAAAGPGAPVFCGEHMTQWRYVRDAAELLEPFEGLMEQLLQEVLAQHYIQLEGKFSIEHINEISRLSEHIYETTIMKTGKKSKMAEGMGSGTEIDKAAQTGGTPKGNEVIKRAMALSANTECTYIKDCVLSLVSIPGMVKMPIDQTQSASKIFCNFAERCLSEDLSLSTLSLLDGRHECDGNLPSWCPNFARPETARTKPLMGNWCANGAVNGEMRMPWAATYFEREGSQPVFRAMGWQVDKIDGLGAISHVDFYHLALGKAVDCDVVQSTSRRRASRGEASAALWRTLTASTRCPTDGEMQDILFALTDVPPFEASPDYARWHFLQASQSLVFNFNTLSSLLHQEPTPYSVSPEALRMRKEVTARIKNRRLAVTAKGRLALVPAATQKGDQIAILVSHGTPMVIRPKKREGGDMWCEIIGEAFVDGIMSESFGRMLVKKESWYTDLLYLHCM